MIEHPEKKALYKARLHAGEVEVMILASEEEADLVIIDDDAAKKTAKFMGLHVTGTLGVIVKAKNEGIIREVALLLEKLKETKFYIDKETESLVLKNAGEA